MTIDNTHSSHTPGNLENMHSKSVCEYQESIEQTKHFEVTHSYADSTLYLLPAIGVVTNICPFRMP